MRSIPRYPEVREDGSMWVPLAPPPPPVYQRLSQAPSESVGARAVLSYSTEWLMDLRIYSGPHELNPGSSREVVKLCDEGAWHDFERHGIAPHESDLIIASVELVFLTQE